MRHASVTDSNKQGVKGFVLSIVHKLGLIQLPD